jgi:hypothetical protein
MLRSSDDKHEADHMLREWNSVIWFNFTLNYLLGTNTHLIRDADASTLLHSNHAFTPGGDSQCIQFLLKAPPGSYTGEVTLRTRHHPENIGRADYGKIHSLLRSVAMAARVKTMGTIMLAARVDRGLFSTNWEWVDHPVLKGDDKERKIQLKSTIIVGEGQSIELMAKHDYDQDSFTNGSPYSWWLDGIR